MLCVCVHFKDLHNKFFKKKKNPRGKEGERESEISRHVSCPNGFLKMMVY